MDTMDLPMDLPQPALLDFSNLDDIDVGMFELENFFQCPNAAVDCHVNVPPGTNEFEGEADLCEPELWTLQTKIITHPLYQRLVKANFERLKLGQAEEAKAGIDLQEERYWKSLEANVRFMPEAGAEVDEELDAFMLEYCSTVETQCGEMQSLLKKTSKDLDFYEQRLQSLMIKPVTTHTSTPSQSMSAVESSGCEVDQDQRKRNRDGGESVQAASDHASLLTPEIEDKETAKGFREEYDTIQEINRVHGQEILTLKRKFVTRKKPEKLPAEAVAIFRDWWSRNIVWPYPTDEERKELAKASGLQLPQVNNWYINMRKRHWLRQFPRHSLKHPQDSDEAHASLIKIYGTIDQALETMNLEM
ncbi:hypothetical protein CYMTET_19491 [Cymbomonas tetramitiformis]|uniref:Homeobox domain-containing protein n=1 Tax=Cymbomonas tetramitiformis TaxID=36881 RepID=A0AAE0G5Z4_9CHLO|nr:hypothetical protein CYMTET_19491 [Cymbomonas tetramitiformis]